MKSLRVGRSSSGRTVATSSTVSPRRTPTRGAPAPTAYTPYGRWSSPNPSLMRSLQEAEAEQVVEGLAHAAGAVRREPAAGAAQVAGAGEGDQVVGVVVVEHLGDLGDR